MKPDKVIEISQHLILKHHYNAAFHQAGHAAGIYLNSKINELPSGNFYIVKLRGDNDSLALANDFKLKVIGGRLVETLSAPNPHWFSKRKQSPDSWETINSKRMLALEADIVNLLLGSIAEAKYVAESDGELFNADLVNLNALNYYGGSQDLRLVDEYLEYWVPNKIERNKKRSELFAKAFAFINDYSNWRAITRLANYILKHNKSVIKGGEIAAVLEESKYGQKSWYTGT